MERGIEFFFIFFIYLHASTSNSTVAFTVSFLLAFIYLVEITKSKSHHIIAMAPQTQKQWRVQGTGSFENLTFNESAEVPKLGDKDVLVKCKPKTCSGGVKHKC